MVFDKEKSIQYKIIKKLKKEGISKNTFYKWKLYHNFTYDNLISQGKISISIAVLKYKKRIKKQKFAIH